MDLEFTDRSGKPVPFPSRRFCLGSSDGCDLRYAQLQPRHLEVLQDPSGMWRVRDVSGSGTLQVDGVGALEALLKPGSVVAAGTLQLKVRKVEIAGGKTEAMAAHVPGRLGEGTVLGGRYRIVAWIAEGGMGEVYRAEHLELGKAFAIKVMRRELSGDEEFVVRFKREAIAASRIGHKNIVDISDFGLTDSGRLYFVMEFLEGSTLSAVMGKQGAMDPARVVNVGLQCARALGAAHKAGILHRDLKPENVMLLQRPQQPDFVKVLDFGTAKDLEDTSEAGQTAMGMVVGTPSYMSPEQAAGLPVDARTDIYALGLILYELLVGKATFDAATPSRIQSAHMGGELAALPEIDGLPPQLGELIAQMVSRKVHQRPGSMDEVVARLEAPVGATAVVPALEPPVRKTTVDAPRSESRAAVKPVRQRRVAAGPLHTEVEVDLRQAASPPTRRVWPIVLVALVLAGAAAAAVVWFR